MGSIVCPHCNINIGYTFRKPKKCRFCNIWIDDPRPALTDKELGKLMNGFLTKIRESKGL